MTHTGRLAVGQTLPPRQITTVRSGPVPLVVPNQLTHLQFRRYAGCPICNLHLRSFTTRYDELRAAGIRELAVFHSGADTLAPYQEQLPFDLIADPARQLYREFGVEASVRAVVNPRTWLAAARGWSRNLPDRSDTGEGGHLGLPADFLIASDGTILACKYGAHADDQWSIDELLELVRQRARPA